VLPYATSDRPSALHPRQDQTVPSLETSIRLRVISMLTGSYAKRSDKPERTSLCLVLDIDRNQAKVRLRHHTLTFSDGVALARDQRY
jgi:hypothetical protein